MSEWRDPRDIDDDFASGNAERIRKALAGLREFAKDGDELELAPIDASLIIPFGDTPPAETVTDLARLVARYRSFVPQPTRADTLRQLAELAVRYGVSQVVYDTSVEIQLEPDPAAAARAVVEYIGWRGLANPREIAAARELVFYLFGAKEPVWRATAEALASWPRTAANRELIAGVLPLIDPDQRALLKREG